ncbi:MAG: DUF4136 domain-containing protein [Sandaracinaceae bacterium]|nr:DUF4136 domain-containing protein [Sandaracinaceae bacterium]
MERTRTLWTLALSIGLTVALTLSGCGSSFHVAHRTTIDPASHTLRSYAIVSHPVNRGELDELVETSMHEVMSSRGYSRAGSVEQADMLVSFGVLLTDPRNDPATAMSDSDLSTNPDAPVRTKTLVVMLHDARTREVIWMGVSTTSAVDSALREHAEEILADLRDRIPSAPTSG